MTQHRITRNFTHEEFTCKCGCGRNNVHYDFIRRLQMLRTLIRRPLTIVSGCRCPKHNEDVGGATRSRHLRGLASDVKAKGLTPEQIAEIARSLGFGGIGIGKTFVHLDFRTTAATWFYY